MTETILISTNDPTFQERLLLHTSSNDNRTPGSEAYEIVQGFSVLNCFAAETVSSKHN